MTHFLSRLVDRVRENAPRVEPIIASRFETAPSPDMTPEVESAGTQHERAVPARTVARHSPIASEIESETRRTGPRLPDEPEIKTDPQLVAERFRPAPDAISRRNPEQPHSVRSKRKTPQAQRSNRLSASTASPAPTREEARRGSPLPEGPEKEPPVVRVTIGRIEVRAAAAPAPPARRPVRAAKPALTLDAYLKARKEGAR